MNVSINPVKSNYNIVSVGNLTMYFSYETIIAFKDNGKLTISKNVWSVTTGKHLNWIDTDKSIRVSHDEFEQKLNVLLKRINVLPDRFNVIR